MSSFNWVATYGDWNDPNSWLNGTIPTTLDQTVFGPGTQATVVGTSYVGDIVLQDASVDISGYFSSDGINPTNVLDQGSPTSQDVLTVENWGQLTASNLNLSYTSIFLQGLLIDQSATVQNVTVSGSSAEWLTLNSDISGQFTVVNGGQFIGNMTLEDKSIITIDTSSVVNGGTLSTIGNVSLNCSGDTVSGDASLFSIGDAIYLSSGSTLAINADAAARLQVMGGISGSGTLDLIDVVLVAGKPSLNTGPIGGLAGVTGGNPIGTTYNITSSTLDMSSELSIQTGLQKLYCSGTIDNIIGGDAPIIIFDAAQDLTVSQKSGSVTLFCGPGSTSVSVGAGDASIQGGAGSLSVVGGTGALIVWGGSSLNDKILGGLGSNTIVGGQGAIVTGRGTVGGVYGDSQSNALIDVSMSSGNNTIFSGSGSGTTTMIGGLGSDTFLGGSTTMEVLCGVGPDQVWSGAATHNSVHGGLGGDLIGLGAAGSVTLQGAACNSVLSSGEGTFVDASSTSGSLMLFAVGNGSTSIIEGGGNSTVVCSNTQVSISGGSGAATIWANNGATVSAFSGQAITMFASNGTNTLQSGTNDGRDVFYTSDNSGTIVDLGGGNATVVVADGPVTVNASAGSDTIFGGSGSLSIDLSHSSGLTSPLVMFNYVPATDSIAFSPGQPFETVVLASGTELVSGMDSVLLYGYFGQVSAST